MVALVCLLPFVFTSHFGTDEFQFLYEAKQIAGGAVPIRDFFEFIMPGAFLVLGAWFKLVGPSLFAARLLQAACLATLAVLLWRLARTAGAGRFLAPLPALALLWVLVPRSFSFSHHWLAQTALGATLGAVWYALGRSHTRAWAIVGVAAGITYAMQQLYGAALGAGLVATVAWSTWIARERGTEALKRLGWLLAGWSLPIGGLTLYFVAHGALGDAWWATHLWPLSHYRAVGGHNDLAYATALPQEISTMSGWISRPHWYATLAVAVTGTFLPLVLLVGGAAWLWGLGRSAVDRPMRFAGALVFIGGLAFLAATRGRADLTHLLHALPAHLLLVTLAVAAWERGAAAWPGAGGVRWLPRLALLGLVLAGMVRVVETVRHTPESWLSLSSPDDRLRRTEALRAVADRLGPGDTLAGGPIGAFFYFYLAPNATRYSYWVRPEDGYTSPEQHAEIIQAIQQRRPAALFVVTAGGRATADAFVRELLGLYRFDTTVAYPTHEPEVPFKVYVYRTAAAGSSTTTSGP
jgi:hypothetical protein